MRETQTILHAELLNDDLVTAQMTVLVNSLLGSEHGVEL